MQRTQLIIAIGSALSAATGAGAGFVYGRKMTARKYEEILDQEIEAAKDFYAQLNKADYPSPVDAVRDRIGEVETSAAKEAADALAVYQGQKVQTVSAERGITAVAEEIKTEVQEANEEGAVTVQTKAQQSSIFFDGQPLDPDDFDYEAENENRRNGVPYVISREEYEIGAAGGGAVADYEQEILTYFRGDDTLVDENEAQIDDVEEIVGKANLNRFGHGSGDPKVVYIRNEAREMDIEVLLSDGSYAEEVLGLTNGGEDELRHSATPRRMRRSYDE